MQFYFRAEKQVDLCFALNWAEGRRRKKKEREVCKKVESGFEAKKEGKTVTVTTFYLIQDLFLTFKEEDAN